MAPIFTGFKFGFGGGGGFASGGTILTPGDGYTYHIFTSPGTSTFTISSGSKNIDYFVVAGGGGGGEGGGGAGGVLTGTLSAVSSPILVTIGTGGLGGQPSPSPYLQGNPGNPSSFGPVTAIGGGGGGYGPGYSGGSGGGEGASGTSPNQGFGLNPSTPAAVLSSFGLPSPYAFTQGYPGGSQINNQQNSAGGGGAGGAGADNLPGTLPGGPGGIGIACPFPLPASYGAPGPSPGRWFAGGGGGSSSPNNPGPSGLGGGLGGPYAGGGNGYGSVPITAGGTNTGGGGGGSRFSPPGQPGGPGIVIVRYLT